MDAQAKLDAIARDSWYCKGANEAMIHYSAKVFKRFLREGDILELGPAEGVMTESLLPFARTLTLVEGASHFCAHLREKYPQAEVINSLIEDVELSRTYDFIVLGHVLEHVEDPVFVLSRLRAFLRPGGRILSAVPNARSLHRQAAVLMGLLEKESALNATDIHHGHQRVYDPELFRQHFLQAGYTLDVFGGYWLKPVSNHQIETSWTSEMLEAFMALGERYPDIAGELYIVASLA